MSQDYDILPEFKSKKCKYFAFILYITLTISPFIAMLLLYISYDFLVCLAGGIASYIFLGIIISKLRVVSIPYNTIEQNYSNYEVCRWFVYRNNNCI